MILPVPRKQVTAIWKPRRFIQNIARPGAVPNINDQDLFPTFEAAEKIEKLKKDDEKKRSFFCNWKKFLGEIFVSKHNLRLEIRYLSFLILDEMTVLQQSHLIELHQVLG